MSSADPKAMLNALLQPWHAAVADPHTAQHSQAAASVAPPTLPGLSRAAAAQQETPNATTRFSSSELARRNGIATSSTLQPGQVLKIPSASEARLSQDKPSVSGMGPGDETDIEPSGEEQSYIVQQGDNLYRIGLRYGVAWQTLMSYNNMHDPSELSAGQELKIPP